MKLKKLPEDFVVNEISNLKTTDNGRYLYLKVWKRNRNTLDVVKEIAKRVHIREKDVGFAGSKDRHAVTTQVISLRGVSKDKVEKVNLDNVKIEILGYGNGPITLGDLQGNSFEIVLRDLGDITIDRASFIVNYFDEQRFGSNNAAVGRCLIKKEFKEACELLELEGVNNDYIGALTMLPNRLLRMFVNAYQSYLWNETVAKYLSSKEVVKEVKYSLGKFVFVSSEEEIGIPLIGFGSFELEDPKIQEIIAAVMKEEDIAYHDFIIKQIPALSLEGELRRVFVPIKDLVIGRFSEDEEFLGRRKVKVEFSLGKGSYATMVIRRLFE